MNTLEKEDAACKHERFHAGSGGGSGDATSLLDASFDRRQHNKALRKSQRDAVAYGAAVVGSVIANALTFGVATPLCFRSGEGLGNSLRRSVALKRAPEVPRLLEKARAELETAQAELHSALSVSE